MRNPAVPDLSMRFVAAYAALAFPLALFCAIPFFDRPEATDGDWEVRHLQRARLLILAAPVHVLFPLTALAMARDTVGAHPANGHADGRRRTGYLAGIGIGVSMVTFVVVSALWR
jgi:hypothetical protein